MLSNRLIAIPDGTPGSYGPPGKTVQPTQPAPAKVEKKGDSKKASATPAAAKAAPKATTGSDGDQLNDQIIAQVFLVWS